MELSVECSYPVGEATSTGLIIMSGYDHDENWQTCESIVIDISLYCVFLRQIQGVLYIILLQALTTQITEAPLSTCEGEVLNWKGRSPVSGLVLHHVGSTSSRFSRSEKLRNQSYSNIIRAVIFKFQHLPGLEHHLTNALLLSGCFWTLVSMLVQAGLFSLFTCCFVIFFHTRYRRVEAEEKDACDSSSSSPLISEQPHSRETADSWYVLQRQVTAALH